MRQATQKKNKTESVSGHIGQRIQEGVLIIISAIAVYLFISLVTYHQSDPGWSATGTGTAIENAGGRLGAWFADFALYIFGYPAYLLPILIAWAAWMVFRQRHYVEERHHHGMTWRIIGFVMVMLAGSGLASLHLDRLTEQLPYSAGGVLGDVVGYGLNGFMNSIGSTLLLIAFFLTGLTLCTGVSWFNMLEGVGRAAMNLPSLFLYVWDYLLDTFDAWRERWAERREERAVAKEELRRERQAAAVAAAKAEKENARKKPKIAVAQTETAPPAKSKKLKIKVPSPAPPKTDKREIFAKMGTGTLPSLALLDKPDQTKKKGYSHTVLERMSRDVEARLLDFGVTAQVVAVRPGPVITRFELEPAPGVKASKISGLAKDLARSLSVVSVRVVEVIPGKSVVGLELPNEDREMVRLSEALCSDQYQNAVSPLSMALGKDIAGHSVVVDLAKMPHLLVAGTTGSGKSVGLNAMLLSLLYKASPDDVRMILIDPKMLELSIYDGVPHLLTPVVTDMKEAANALRWCVAEMDRRYRLMAALGVRNLSGFNKKVKAAKDKGQPIIDPLWQAGEGAEQPPELETLPYIVVLIDEFADMMMVVGKKVEELIARIAQKARAAGIHLILATQRPSVDVITGLIKANVPTRIAFQVSSRIDSRTIIDQQGAEQLLGHGDMLYLPPGSGVPVRVHGAFVADEEVHNVVDDWKKRAEPNYHEEILRGDGVDADAVPGIPDFTSDGDSESDPLYDKAVQIVIESRRASISNVQRRLKIGYNRAARIIEDMEAAGLVSPMESNGSREVLVPQEH